MRVSGKGFAEILSHEAAVTRRYKDSVGVWTYGVGHTAAAGPPNPVNITEDQPLADILQLFRADLKKYEAAVDRAVKVDLAQHEFDAAVSFHFNTGAIARASWVKRLNAGDRAGAAKGLMTWNKPKEIIGRRTAEMKLFRDGVYSNNGTFTVYPASAKGAVLWGRGKRVRVADVLSSMEPVAAPPKAVIKRAADIARKEIIKDVQNALRTVGFYEVGDTDGNLGDRTKGAISSYRTARSLPLSEDIDDALIEDLNKAVAEGWKRPIAKERAEKPKEEIAKKSATLKTTWWGKILAIFGIGGGAAGNTVKELFSDPDQIDSRLTLLQRLGGFIADNFILIAGITIAGVGIFAAFQVVDHLRVKAEREGRHFSG